MNIRKKNSVIEGINFSTVSKALKKKSKAKELTQRSDAECMLCMQETKVDLCSMWLLHATLRVAPSTSKYDQKKYIKLKIYKKDGTSDTACQL